jgi:hypothetical protein
MERPPLQIDPLGHAEAAQSQLNFAAPQGLLLQTQGVGAPPFIGSRVQTGNCPTCPANFFCGASGFCQQNSCTSDSECSGFCVKGWCYQTRGTCEPIPA